MKFKVILRGSIMGCMSPKRKKDIAIIDVYVPKKFQKDSYEATTYIEIEYGFFVLDIIKES